VRHAASRRARARRAGASFGDAHRRHIRRRARTLGQIPTPLDMPPMGITRRGCAPGPAPARAL